MLHRMAPHGYVRETHDTEEDEFGIGFIAVLDNDENWFSSRQAANAALIEMKAARAIRKGADQ